MTSPEHKKVPHSGDHGDTSEAEVESLTLPLQSTKRKTTNSAFIIAYVVCLLLMVPFSTIMTWGSDMNRLLYGYDKYGNICGMKNKPVYGINCSGQDMRSKPYAHIRYVPINRCFEQRQHKILPYVCVENCDIPHELIFNRCFPPTNVDLNKHSIYYKQILVILHSAYEYVTTILAMALTGLIISFGIYFCLSCHVGATFWALVVFQLIASCLAVSFFTHKYITNEENTTLYLMFALGSICYLTFMLVFLCVLHNAITFVHRIYEKALSAIFKIPALLIQPLLIILALIIITLSLIFLIITVLSSGCLKRTDHVYLTYEYVTNIYNFIYACYLIIMLVWTFYFAHGIQCLTVSGSVSQYYFEKEKDSLQRPLKKNLQTVGCYHLGTAALGSLIMTSFSFVGNIFEYVIRKVYIITALRGLPFWKSSSQAFRLLFLNLVQTVAVTGFSYILIYGFVSLVILITMGVGMWINLETKFSNYIYISILLGAVVTSMMAYFIVGVLSIATDTVFLCLGEEHLMRSEDHKYVYMYPELFRASQTTTELKRIRTQRD